jgi:sugar phosphate isomerase/epimerase
MLIGFSAYSLRFSAGFWHRERRMTAFDLLNVAKEVGADGAMLNPHFFPEPFERSLEEASGLARDLGLFIEIETGGTDPEHLRRMIDASKSLGASVLRTFIGGGLDRYRAGYEVWQQKLKGAEAQLRQVASYAKERGMRIALENHGDVRTGELLRLIENVGSEWVGVCLDTGNQLFLLEDPMESAEKLAPYTFSTHIKAYRVAFCTEGMVVEGCALFDDDIPNREIVSVLIERSPLKEKLHLNLEVPFERIVVPFFDGRYLEALGEVSLSEAVKALRYAKGKWAGEVEELTYSDDLPQREMERLKLSVQRARKEWR